MAPDLDWTRGDGVGVSESSDIPWVERQALASLGEDYRAYQRTGRLGFHLIQKAI